MKTGIVKAYLLDQGYGWIGVEGENDYWVHFSGIHPDPLRFPPVPPSTIGFQFLKPGQTVSFEVAENQIGVHGSKVAINVVVLD